jgi:hypothetical protein
VHFQLFCQIKHCIVHFLSKKKLNQLVVMYSIYNLTMIQPPYIQHKYICQKINNVFRWKLLHHALQTKSPIGEIQKIINTFFFLVNIEKKIGLKTIRYNKRLTLTNL